VARDSLGLDVQLLIDWSVDTIGVIDAAHVAYDAIHRVK